MFLIAACGGPPVAPTAAPLVTQAPGAATPAPTSPPVGATTGPVIADVCALLTPADINMATGETTYVDGTLDSVGQCLWNVEGATGNTGSLIVGHILASELSFIKSVFGEGGSDVSVAGRPAFYNPTEGLGSIWVDLGNGSLLVLSFPQSSDLDPSYQALAIQLAEIALGNM